MIFFQFILNENISHLKPLLFLSFYYSLFLEKHNYKLRSQFFISHLFLLCFIIACTGNTQFSNNLGHQLESLRIEVIKNSDAYENIMEFNQEIDAWNNLKEKNQADSFFHKLCKDYNIKINVEKTHHNTNIFLVDSMILEIMNPLFPHQTIEIPVINFYPQNQKLELQSSLIYFKNFALSDFKNKKNQIIGKTLVLELYENQFFEYIEASKFAGILGLIIILKEGNQVPCYQYIGTHKIPILGVSQDDGFFLVESLKKYPKQYVRIYIHQKIITQKTHLWKWEKNFYVNKNLYVFTHWKSNICNKGILSYVAPSLILLDIAKILQKLEWQSNYNIIFLWFEGEECNINMREEDLVINLDGLTDFIGWQYPIKNQNLWKKIQNYLILYDEKLTFRQYSKNHAEPIVTDEIKKMANMDTDEIEWIHKDMILRSLGMVALTIYLLSIS